MELAEVLGATLKVLAQDGVVVISGDMVRCGTLRYDQDGRAAGSEQGVPATSESVDVGTGESHAEQGSSVTTGALTCVPHLTRLGRGSFVRQGLGCSWRRQGDALAGRVRSGGTGEYNESALESSDEEQ